MKEFPKADDLMAGCSNNGLANENPPLDDWSVVGCHWPGHSSHRCLRMELSLCWAGAIIRTDRWVRRAADGRTNRAD